MSKADSAGGGENIPHLRFCGSAPAGSMVSRLQWEMGSKKRGARGREERALAEFVPGAGFKPAAGGLSFLSTSSLRTQQ